MARTQEERQQIALTIIAQLGGNRFKAMTGANHFAATQDGLRFTLPGRTGFVKDKINMVEVHLTPDDLYTMVFSHVAGPAKGYAQTVVARIEGVYAESLQELFTKRTGLDTSL